MRAKSKENFTGCLTENKEYEVLSTDSAYILIVEDNGRKVWNWIGLFYIVDNSDIKSDIKIKNNFNFI